MTLPRRRMVALPSRETDGPVSGRAWGRWLLCLSLVPLGLAACRAPLSERLHSVGIELVGEREAFIPPEDRGRFLPCRVPEGARWPALPPHPDGYLIVELEGVTVGSATELRRALERLPAGSLAKLRVRRNPYVGSESEWWEMTVSIRLP